MGWYEEPLIADELAQLAEPPAPNVGRSRVAAQIGLLIGVGLATLALLIGLI